MATLSARVLGTGPVVLENDFPDALAKAEKNPAGSYISALIDEFFTRQQVRLAPPRIP